MFTTLSITISKDPTRSDIALLMKHASTIIGIAAGTVALVAAILGGQYYSTVTGIDDRARSALSGSGVHYARHAPQFWQDQEILDKYAFLKPRPCTRDAGSYLNPRIHWDGEDAQVSESFRGGCSFGATNCSLSR